jgi:hypothetical protein
MSTTFAQRLVERVAGRANGPDRRGFLIGAAIGGAAVVSAPWTFLTRPASAYEAVCGTASTCSGGNSVFCCSINGGQNACPPQTFISGWWKSDNTALCNGAARYYVDCNAFVGGPYTCTCNTDPNTCDNRRTGCNQFRYGQCSTDVPASQTGPVVCRLVSCTPPWQQYAGTCSSSSRTENATATHTAPCVSDVVPAGAVDSITSPALNTVRIVGWAFDSNNVAVSISVDVYADGALVGRFPTNLSRPDVNGVYGIGGTHGFDITATVPGGQRRISVFAINLPGPGINFGNPLLAERVVTVTGESLARGFVDQLTGTGGRIRATGWAYDPDSPSASTQVQLIARLETVSKTGTATVTANISRPDVNAALGITGNHGYDVSLAARPGRHVVQVWALNGGPGPDPALLTERTIDVVA